MYASQIMKAIDEPEALSALKQVKGTSEGGWFRFRSHIHKEEFRRIYKELKKEGSHEETTGPTTRPVSYSQFRNNRGKHGRSYN